jgi:FdhE protein
MASKFFSKLLGGGTAIPAEVAAVVERLQKLAGARPELAGATAALSEILPSLFSTPTTEAPPTLSEEQAHAKLQGGLPLLRGENLSLDVSAFSRRWAAICAAVRRHQMSDTALSLDGLLRRGKLLPQEMLQQVLAGQPGAVAAQVEELGGDAGLATTVLRLSLFPVLSRACQILEPFLAGLVWRQGFCPVCGSWPLLGEFRGLEQTRFLRCGLCAAGWELPRLHCPFCGNTDHRTLGYFHVEGEEERCRAATCDACHAYVKILSTLQALSGPDVLATDVETMHLDLAMLERGYLVN